MEKVVLVTGCSSGIGEYVANKYLENNNYKVIGLDINPCNISSTNFTFCQVNLQDEEAVQKVFKNISSLDLAVNCAGVSSTRKPLSEFTALEITKCWQENFLLCFNSLKAELKIMKAHKKGKIINIASLLGHIGKSDCLAYSIAKASVINMTKVAAIENSTFNIRVNSISPATIDTPLIRKKYNGVLRDYSDVFHTRNHGVTNDVYTMFKML